MAAAIAGVIQAAPPLTAGPTFVAFNAYAGAHTISAGPTQSLVPPPAVSLTAARAPSLSSAATIPLPPVASPATPVAPVIRTDGLLLPASTVVLCAAQAPTIASSLAFDQVINAPPVASATAAIAGLISSSISIGIPPAASTSVAMAPAIAAATPQTLTSGVVASAAATAAPSIGMLASLSIAPSPINQPVAAVAPIITRAEPQTVALSVVATQCAAVTPSIVLLRRFPMSEMMIWTYQDAIDTVWDQAGQDPSPKGMRDVKRAIQNAYRDLPNIRNWSCLYKLGRIVTEAPYSTGTIAYTAVSRTVTLTGGTWPTWAGSGVLVIDSTRYLVAERSSNSAIKLAVGSTPTGDIAAGKAYQIYLDEYDLPEDFASSDYLFELGQNTLEYVPAGDMATRGWMEWSPSTPQCWTVTGARDRARSLKARLSPPPSTGGVAYEFVYRRVPRPLTIDVYADGTITGVALSTQIVGVGTSFTSAMVGSILRVGTALNEPTGRDGANPFRTQRTIVGVVDGSTLQVDRELEENISAAKYTVSDPIDLDVNVLLTAFLRQSSLEYSKQRNRDDRAIREQEWRQAVQLAQEADNRLFGTRSGLARGGASFSLADLKR